MKFLQFWDASLNQCEGDCDAAQWQWQASMPAQICTAILVFSTLVVMIILISSVWRVLWDSITGFKLVQVITCGFLRKC